MKLQRDRPKTSGGIQSILKSFSDLTTVQFRGGGFTVQGNISQGEISYNPSQSEPKDIVKEPRNLMKIYLAHTKCYSSLWLVDKLWSYDFFKFPTLHKHLRHVATKQELLKDYQERTESNFCFSPYNWREKYFRRTSKDSTLVSDHATF